MRRIPDLLLALACAAVGGPPRHVHHAPPWNEITLEVESFTPRPVVARVIVTSSHPPPDAPWPGVSRPHVDSTTGATPLLIPLDSAAIEVRVVTAHDQAVRVRIQAAGRELQRPSLAWGRDIRLRRVGGYFDVAAAAMLITP